MTRQQQTIMLIVVGAVTANLTLSGNYLNYVKSWQYPYLLAAAAILLALGLIGFFASVRTSGDSAQEPHRPADNHAPTTTPPPSGISGDEHGLGIGWLLCLPMFIVFLVLPPALGSNAADRDGATVPQPAPGTRFPPLPPADPAPIKVSDYAVRAVWDRGHTLQGRTLSLTGFVSPKPGGGWYLTRMKVTCCAADARSYQIALLPTANEFTTDNWLQITGTWTPSTETDPSRAIPRINTTTIHQIPQPHEPYE